MMAGWIRRLERSRGSYTTPCHRSVVHDCGGGVRLWVRPGRSWQIQERPGGCGRGARMFEICGAASVRLLSRECRWDGEVEVPSSCSVELEELQDARPDGGGESSMYLCAVATRGSDLLGTRPRRHFRSALSTTATGTSEAVGWPAPLWCSINHQRYLGVHLNTCRPRDMSKNQSCQFNS